MAITSRSGFKALKGQLKNAAKLQFQRLCFELLSVAWPELRYPQDLGIHDRRGVDFFAFASPAQASTGRDYQFVIQCKGVEDTWFGPDDFRGAIRDVERFSKGSHRTDTYWLVLNRDVREGQWREALDDAIESLKASGRAKRARWLGPQSLLLVLFDELGRQVRQRMRERNRIQLDTYNEIMRAKRHYVADVPYRAEMRKRAASGFTWVPRDGRNPCHAIAESLKTRDASPASNSVGGSQRFRLVISEFGFGKTLLLLELASAIGGARRAVVYQPVVELGRGAFSNEKAFIKAIYECFFPDDELHPMLVEPPPLVAFRELLRYDPNAVLLIDGLDEHHRFYTLDGLRDIFGSVKDLACAVVMTVRKEFFDAHEGNFGEAMTGTGNDRQRVYLQDWDEAAMLSFLRDFGQAAGIKTLRSRIRAGEFDRHYGDIPRRPLFLEMLATDMRQDPNRAHDLASLYRRYIVRKMERDLETPFKQGHETVRPVPGDMDLLPFRARLVELQERLAAETVTEIDGVDAQVLRGEIAEDEVVAAAAAVGFDGVPLSKLLQHSVLVPSGRTARRAQLTYRFAHRSFQEFLAASWIVQTEGDAALERRAVMPPGVVRFVEQLLIAPPVEEDGGHP